MRSYFRCPRRHGRLIKADGLVSRLLGPGEAALAGGRISSSQAGPATNHWASADCWQPASARPDQHRHLGRHAHHDAADCRETLDRRETVEKRTDQSARLFESGMSPPRLGTAPDDEALRRQQQVPSTACHCLPPPFLHISPSLLDLSLTFPRLSLTLDLSPPFLDLSPPFHRPRKKPPRQSSSPS